MTANAPGLINYVSHWIYISFVVWLRKSREPCITHRFVYCSMLFCIYSSNPIIGLGKQYRAFLRMSSINSHMNWMTKNNSAARFDRAAEDCEGRTVFIHWFFEVNIWNLRYIGLVKRRLIAFGDRTYRTAIKPRALHVMRVAINATDDLYFSSGE